MRLVLASLCSSILVGGLLAGGGGAAATAGSVHRPGPISLSSSSVAEDAARGTVIGDFAASDRDPGYRHTFALVDGKGDDDNDLFRIRGNHLLVGGALDFEADPDLSVRVRVTDRSGRWRERHFRVEVRDVADQPPTDLLLSGATVEENQPAGTVVGTLSTVDPAGPRTYTYRLLSGTDAFTLVGDQLRTAGPLDHEVAATRTVRIQSVTGPGDSVEKDLSISVTDVNEAPTAITLSPDSAPEGLVNEVVGTLTAADPDQGDTRTFALVPGAGSADNGIFSVAGDLLRTLVPLDYETRPIYQVRVRVTDSEGATFEAPLIVHAIDTTEPAPEPPAAPSNLRLTNDSVPEDSPLGTDVGNAVADGDGLTYTLVSGGSCRVVPARRSCRAAPTFFTMTPGGVLETGNVPFDFESGTDSYPVTIRATASNGEWIEGSFTITIDDVNEAPTDITVSSFGPVSATSGSHPLGHLAAVDQDAGDTATFTVAGAVDPTNAPVGAGVFTIQGSCGGPYLWVNTSGLLPGTYTVTVRATDHGGLFRNEDVQVQVTSIARIPAFGAAGLRRC